MKKSKIKDIVLAVTYKCNSRCRMCDIWQKKDFSGELLAADYATLPPDLESINITGGEPFLRADLPEIIRVIQTKCPEGKIIISSNGFATDLIVNRMKEIIKHAPNIGVVFSIDGIGVKHDEIRGIPGGYESVLRSVAAMKEMGVKIKIAFTLGDYNFDELPLVYQLSKELDVEMSLSVVHAAEEYFAATNKITKTQELVNRLNWLIQEELSAWHPKNWARAYFAYGAKIFIATKERILPDYAGESSAFVNPIGNIYPSDISNRSLGHLSRDGFDFSPSRSEKRESSWMVCTTRQAIRRHYLRAIAWFVVNKTKSIFYNLSRKS